jgi:hypothetical protein
MSFKTFASFCCQDNYLITGSINGVKVWQVKDGKLLHKLDAYLFHNKLNNSILVRTESISLFPATLTLLRFGNRLWERISYI